MTHFANLGHIKIITEYKKPIVLFGKSNTDQSYYEPTSSRINNSLKYGTTPTGEKMTIEDCFKVPIKPNGLTREESFVYANNEINTVKTDIENKGKKSKLDKLIEKSTEFVEKNTQQMSTEQT